MGRRAHAQWASRETDFALFQSTCEGQAAFQTAEGSLYLSIVREVLGRAACGQGPATNVCRLFRQVNGVLVKRHRGRQAAQIVDQLCGDVFLE